MKMQISASLMCANPLNLEKDVRELEQAGIDFWHMDIMDGVYVPNIALNFETTRAVDAISSVPIDAHLMVVQPENYLEMCAKSGVDYVSFHLEQVPFPQRLIQRIKDLGMKAGVAINPSTSLGRLPYILDQLDYVLVMTVEPGFAGQKFIHSALPKIAKIKQMAEEKNLVLPIQVDGNINVTTGALSLSAGAQILVAGTSSVFRTEGTLTENLSSFRKALLARDSEGGVVLGVDIGGTNVRLALVNENGVIRASEAISVSSLGTIDPLAQLKHVISKFVVENIGSQQLLAMGVGVPGIVDATGEIISCPNLGFLEHSGLGDMLRRELQVPVFIDKDVNFILYGECHTLGLRETKNLIGFYIGTGFGCSLVINGEIYRGSHGFAGELGHIPVQGHFDRCNCGNKGCLELYGAGRALVERSSQLDVPIADFFTSSTIGLESQEFLEYLAVGMLTAINIFDPELVIVGGGVPQMAGFPWNALEQRVRNGLRSELIKDRFQIIPSQAETYGGCLGAAFYCFDQRK